ncbi:hypothetical protein SAMN05216417_11380 [Nitrosospira multiformis]|uniref:Uncharacterized protein n=1 Tax=Nitrosospira multiformis TaxID=1231 RepID=A0A1I7I1A4_9PROT|nr:hypothetical protein SAMN05216417_11380 [Nitrosospira multiformis]
MLERLTITPRELAQMIKAAVAEGHYASARGSSSARRNYWLHASPLAGALHSLAQQYEIQCRGVRHRIP